MTKAEEKQAFTSTYSPMREHEQGGNHDFEEEVASLCGCCRRRRFVGVEGWKTSDQESKYLLQENVNGYEQSKETWVVKNKLKKLKEFSEVLTGPKRKNMVRKIGKHFNPKKSRTRGMAYSPQSYALNFDDGEEKEDDLFVI